jgi:hypothetical protein
MRTLSATDASRPGGRVSEARACATATHRDIMREQKAGQRCDDDDDDDDDADDDADDDDADDQALTWRSPTTSARATARCHLLHHPPVDLAPVAHASSTSRPCVGTMQVKQHARRLVPSDSERMDARRPLTGAGAPSSS